VRGVDDIEVVEDLVDAVLFPTEHGFGMPYKASSTGLKD
jgi:hypothetical protein